jgi:hypothetical protein
MSAASRPPFRELVQVSMIAKARLTVIVACLCGAACLDRTRVNTRCEWTEPAGALDLSDWPQQRHLFADVELAEELAIRYADTVHKDRFGTEGHGGLIENGRFRDRCMATLVSAIASSHDLPLARVEQARARGYRDPRWDAGVLLSFGCLYALMAWAIVRAIARRFPVEDGWPALVAPLVASLPVALAAFQVFTLWGGGLEAIRLGNDHVSSYRAAKSPWPGHAALLSIAAAILFLAIAALHHVSRRSREYP